MRALILLILSIIPITSSAQKHVYVDREKNFYSMAHISKLHREDLFVSYRLIKENEDTILYSIQFYPKAEVAARFQTEGDYCGNRTGRKSITQIRAMHFYSRVASIKLMAFNTVDTSRNHYVPKKEGKVDVSQATEMVTLDSQMTGKFLDILVNFNETREEVETTFCVFEPRNSIVFFDKAGNQMAHIDLCFECLQLEKSPETIPLGLFCSEAYYTLQGFFRSAGILYGTRVTDSD